MSLTTKHTKKRNSAMQVPDGWTMGCIGNLGTIVTGSTPKTSELANYGDEYLFVSPADMGKGKRISNTGKKLSLKGFQSGRALPEDSVMVTCIGSTIGKVGLAASECLTNQQINSIICSVNNYPHFVYYVCSYLKPYFVSLAGTTAVPIINKTEFSQISTNLPPLEEQKKIAAVLSACDECIESTEKQIAKLKDLKKATMQQLLTKGINHTKFKDSPLGQIPQSWKVVRLEILVNKSITYGIVQPGQFTPNGVLLIRAKDYSTGWVDKSNFFRVEESLNNQYKRSIVYPGDLLMTIVGYVGLCVEVPNWIEEANVTQQTARISCDKRLVDSSFIRQSMNSYIGIMNVEKFAKGSAQQSLNLSDLNKFIIPKPSLDEQKKIAEILSSIDDNIENKQQKLSKLKDQKKALMSDLLTGKVRV